MPLLRKTKSFSYTKTLLYLQISCLPPTTKCILHEAIQLEVNIYQLKSVFQKKKKSSLLFTAKIHVVALLKQYINVGTKD